MNGTKVILQNLGLHLFHVFGRSPSPILGEKSVSMIDFFFWNSVTKFWKCKKKPGPKIKPTERKRTRLEASTSNNFDTLFKKGQRSATENNRAEIWSNQIYWILFVLWDFKFPPFIYFFLFCFIEISFQFLRISISKNKTIFKDFFFFLIFYELQSIL